MTPAEIQAQLTLVQSAITTILTGTAQSVSIGGRSYTALSLNDLWKMQSDLVISLAAANAGGIRPAVVCFRTPA